jgi:hypothetical protein
MRLLEHLENINEIVSPQMHKKLKSLQTEFTAIRNQMKTDGHDKEADQVFMEFGDVVTKIKKVYK